MSAIYSVSLSLAFLRLNGCFCILSSEKVNLGAIFAFVRFVFCEIVWRGKRHDLHVVVREQLGSLFVGPLVTIGTKSGLVDDVVSDVLSMLD